MCIDSITRTELPVKEIVAGNNDGAKSIVPPLAMFAIASRNVQVVAHEPLPASPASLTVKLDGAPTASLPATLQRTTVAIAWDIRIAGSLCSGKNRQGHRCDMREEVTGDSHRHTRV
jgi:hypothetical protein